MAIRLAENSYGKSRVRLVHVTRREDRHDLKDLTVGIQLEGDFEAAHTAGDNRKILATDTMKNTVYVMAKKGAPQEIEEFALRLVTHFLERNPQVSKAQVEIVERLWAHIAKPGGFHPSAFLAGGEKRTAVVTGTRQRVSIEAGISDLALLKTSGSAFEDFLHDEYTTLKDALDRILSTSVRARWLYETRDVSFGNCWQGVWQTLVETFAAHQSRSVQHTLYAMGEAVLKRFPAIAEIRITLPNQHCLPVDLSPFQMENNNEIFVPVDEPHGLIEAVIKRS
jgi:urate oxidase